MPDDQKPKSINITFEYDIWRETKLNLVDQVYGPELDSFNKLVNFLLAEHNAKIKSQNT